MENAANRYKYHNGGETKAQKSPEICLRIYLCIEKGKKGEGETKRESDRKRGTESTWYVNGE